MRVLLIDDHHLIRDGLRPVVERLAGHGEAVDVMEASTFAGGLAAAARHDDIDLVLLDLRLPDVAGFEALDRLQRDHPELPVVLMSGDDDPALMRDALARGAVGYIPKSSTPSVIVQALRLVLSGGVYVPAQALGDAKPTPAASSVALTPRQAEVLRLLVAGKSNKEICRVLDLSEGTVKTHLAAIFRALDVTTRVQAVVAAGKIGIKG